MSDLPDERLIWLGCIVLASCIVILRLTRLCAMLATELQIADTENKFLLTKITQLGKGDSDGRDYAAT